MKMMKTVILFLILLLGAIIFSGKIPTLVHASPTITPWPYFRHDLNNTGYTTSLAPNTSNIVWTFNKTVHYQVSSTVVVANDLVLVTSYGDTMEALNERTGAVIWRANFTAGFGPFMTPAVDVAKGLVIVNCFGAHAFALNLSTGAIVWDVQPWISGPGVGGWLLTNPTIDPEKGLVFMGSFAANGQGYIYALNETDGTLVWWKGPFGQGVTDNPLVHNGKLFFADAGLPYTRINGTVWAFNEADGTLLWSYTTLNGNIASSPAYSSGRIYIGSNDGYLYCLDEDTGAQVWNYSAGQHPIGLTGVASSPAIDEARGLVICASDQGYLFALDKNTGAEIWKVAFPGGVQGATGNPAGFIPGGSSPAITGDGVIFISGANNSYSGLGTEMLFAYNETDGTLLWNFTIAVDSAYPPAGPGSRAPYPLPSPVVADEHVFIGSYKWLVYCIGQPFPALTYRLTVRVVDQAGSAVAGANVTVDSVQAFTNSSGYVEFSLMAGSYAINVSKEGYEPASTTVSVSAETETSITLNETAKPTEFPYLPVIIAIVVIVIIIVAVVVALKMRKPSPAPPPPAPETPKT
jgi:outer membrane protein assembly factor BamB